MADERTPQTWQQFQEEEDNRKGMLATVLYGGLWLLEAIATNVLVPFATRVLVPLGRLFVELFWLVVLTAFAVTPPIARAVPGAMMLFIELVTLVVLGTFQTVLFSGFLLIVAFMTLAGGFSLLVHLNASLQLPILTALGTPEVLLINPINQYLSVLMLVISAAAFFRAYGITNWKPKYLTWTPTSTWRQ